MEKSIRGYILCQPLFPKVVEIVESKLNETNLYDENVCPTTRKKIRIV